MIVKGLKELINKAETAVQEDAGAIAESVETYTVFMKDAGFNKSAVVHLIKQYFFCGLLEAKQLLDSAPVVLKSGLSKAEAESWKESFEREGAQIDIYRS